MSCQYIWICHVKVKENTTNYSSCSSLNIWKPFYTRGNLTNHLLLTHQVDIESRHIGWVGCLVLHDSRGTQTGQHTAAMPGQGAGLSRGRQSGGGSPAPRHRAAAAQLWGRDAQSVQAAHFSGQCSAGNVSMLN